MTDVYIYRADIYCGHCAKQIMNQLVDDGANPNQIARDDSEHWPQGPHSDGGGEADSPQHCGKCGLFLENPIAGDGYEYVAEHIGMHAYHDCAGDKSVLRQWADFYAGENVMLDNAIQEWQALKPEDWR